MNRLHVAKLFLASSLVLAPLGLPAQMTDEAEQRLAGASAVEIVELLGSADPARRAEGLVAVLLSMPRSDMDDVFPAIATTLEDANDGVRATALELITPIGWMYSMNWITPHQTPAPLLWASAAEQLRGVAPSVARGLAHPSADIRKHAVRAMLILPGGAPDFAVPDLLRLAREDDDRRVRELAVAVLSNPYTTSEPGIVQRKRPSARAEAVLIDRLLHDPSPSVRAAAARGIGMARISSKAAVSALVETLQSPDQFVRDAAVQAFFPLGTAGKEALPLLEELARSDPDELTRRHAKQAAYLVRGLPMPSPPESGPRPHGK